MQYVTNKTATSVNNTSWTVSTNVTKNCRESRAQAWTELYSWYFEAKACWRHKCKTAPRATVGELDGTAIWVENSRPIKWDRGSRDEDLAKLTTITNAGCGMSMSMQLSRVHHVYLWYTQTLCCKFLQKALYVSDLLFCWCARCIIPCGNKETNIYIVLLVHPDLLTRQTCSRMYVLCGSKYPCIRNESLV